MAASPKPSGHHHHGIPQPFAVLHRLRGHTRVGHGPKGSSVAPCPPVCGGSSGPRSSLPSCAHDGDAGVDLWQPPVTIPATGPARALVGVPRHRRRDPAWHGGQYPRSSLASALAFRSSIAPALSTGWPMGEDWQVALITRPSTPITIRRGDRIAQLLVQRVESTRVDEVASFDEAGLADTTRGDGGHGSSADTCEFVMAFGRRVRTTPAPPPTRPADTPEPDHRSRERLG